jgi:hypothetical protein
MSNSAIRTLRVFDHKVAGRPRPDDLAAFPAPLTSTLTAELDGAQSCLGVPVEELLLAALSRAIARTFGDGDLAVDVNAGGQLTVVLACRNPRSADATEVLRAADRSLAAARHGIAGRPSPSSRVVFSYLGAVPATLPNSGHALEVRAYRKGDHLQMDWWYDTRRLDRTTVEELTEQFPLALIDVTSDAVPPIREPANLAMA